MVIKVASLRYPHGEYCLGKPSEIIDGTHIIDKFKVLSTELVEDKLKIHMKDKDIVLTVVAK